MKVDKYKMKLLHIERLLDNDDAKSIKQMMEQDKYIWREQGLTKQEVKDRMLKKLMAAYTCTGSNKYHRAYCLLHWIMNRRTR